MEDLLTKVLILLAIVIGAPLLLFIIAIICDENNPNKRYK